MRRHHPLRHLQHPRRQLLRRHHAVLAAEAQHPAGDLVEVGDGDPLLELTARKALELLPFVVAGVHEAGPELAAAPGMWLRKRKRPKTAANRLVELLALMMIGDAVVALAVPERHLALWRVGPDWMRRAVDELIARPHTARALAGLELALGLWLAGKQLD